MSKSMHQSVRSSDARLSRMQNLQEPTEQRKLQSDAELLELFISGGDRGAIEALITRYAGMVASVCSLTVADPAIAEDAFQATFLILLKSAKKIKRRSSVAAWLHGVAYRCACRLRKLPRELPSSQNAEDVNALCHDSPDPIAALARKMELETLDRELENLPELLRAPLVEHYLLGFTAPQIAERMELSVPAVEGRLRRGRQALRSRLARRGISLGVLLAGSELFQEHLAAAEAGHWSSQFFDTYLSQVDGSPTHITRAVSSNPQISSLVQGELSMFGSSTIKAAVAASVLLLGGSLVALSVNADDSWRSGRTASPGWTLPSEANAQPVLAQLPQVNQPPEADPNVSGNNGQNGKNNAAGLEFTAPPSAGAMASAKQQAVTWERPELAEDSEPSWLAGGRSAMEAIESNREKLSQKLEFDFNAIPLSEIVAWMSEETGVDIELQTAELSLLGVDPNMPVTVSGSASLRELIRRIGEPHELTYIVTESTIEITSRDAAESHDNMRFYDLAYVLPNSENTDALINAIQQSIDPDSWLAAGGTSSITVVGSMMIVNAPDTTHQKIEVLLLNITKMNPKNAARATPVGGLNAMPGGFGGGMGGMGGGMGGMGGGGGGMF